jgi:hypothetical protein
MTHPNLRPGSTEPAQLALHDPSLGSPTTAAAAAPLTVASLTKAADAREAANDDEAATLNTNRNPLWVIVMGMACLFGVMAVVISVG